MQVWPFPPRNELVEVLAWSTNVIRAKSAEQRIALRTAPRREFNLLHTLTDTEYSAARAMVRGAEVFQVPDWPQAIQLGAVSSGVAVAISDPALLYTDFYDGSAILWQSADDYEVVAVESLAGNYWITSVSGEYSDGYLIPLVEAYAPNGISTSRRAARLHDVDVSFDVYQNNDTGLSTYPQYRSHDLMTDCPVIGSGQFSEGLSWEFSTFDNISGIPEYIRRRTIPDELYQMRWHVFTRSDLYTLRRWVHSRRGRQKVFWLSSLAKDFLPAVSIGPSDTSITVFKLPGIANVGRTESFDIEIKTVSGIYYRRRVTSAAAGAPVNESSTLSLTLSSSLGAAVSIANIDRISFLRCTRFNSDRVEFNHRAGAGTVVQINCIEVPVP